MSRVIFACQTFQIPKAGNTESEYEDAYARRNHGAPSPARYAVADGAETSSFAGLWAWLLVNEFVQGFAPSEHEFWEWCERLGAKWASAVDGRDLPWYAQEKAKRGAFATLLGLTLHRTYWQALAVGDTCLVLVRGDELVESFPVRKADEIGTHPDLVPSRPVRDRSTLPKVRVTKGKWEKGDRFYLATDALAQWFLAEQERGRKPWSTIESYMNPPDRLGILVQKLRADGVMRNDDVTLLRIKVHKSGSKAAKVR